MKVLRVCFTKVRLGDDPGSNMAWPVPRKSRAAGSRNWPGWLPMVPNGAEVGGLVPVSPSASYNNRLVSVRWYCAVIGAILLSGLATAAGALLPACWPRSLGITHYKLHARRRSEIAA